MLLPRPVAPKAISHSFPVKYLDSYLGDWEDTARSHLPMPFRRNSKYWGKYSPGKGGKQELRWYASYVTYTGVMMSCGEFGWILDQWKTNCGTFCEFGLGMIAHFKALNVRCKSARKRIVLDRSLTERCIRVSHPYLAMSFLENYSNCLTGIT